MKFKNHFKQLAVPFKIYLDFESFQKGFRGSDRKMMLYTLKIIKNIPFSFAYKIVYFDDKFSKAVVLYKG